MPRGGRDKWMYSHEDGAESTSSAKYTMSWNSFLYSTDVTAEVFLLEGVKVKSLEEITIRPKGLQIQLMRRNDSTIQVSIPYSNTGYKFSLEFKHPTVHVYNDNGNLNTTQNGTYITTEPQHALQYLAADFVFVNFKNFQNNTFIIKPLPNFRIICLSPLHYSFNFS